MGVPGIAGATLSGPFLESLIEGAKSSSVSTCAVSVLVIAIAAGIWAATRRGACLEVTEISRAN